ncbi:MobF family relaxase [Lichenifustis flavocetrariae]|uniref:Relaxase domain-containing protein n=1 Tax=Lichenifustis flavocetrariae TaxID=2949735 RepID=A0AA41Z1M4_9HYPH|nr:MobF family relaxase [Lichenifustis flavocetrariae]MCW6511332.1 relaxase domain-containing protein [Lichenifustis flavocetrariae]
MTASLHCLGLGASAGTYYTNDPYREAQNRDEYYARDGGGLWWSPSGSVVSHDAQIDLASFRDLCAGFDPQTGKALVRGAGEGHRAGWDVTYSAPKSLSVLWAAADPDLRRQIEAIQAAAVDEALRFLADEALVEVRLGAGGRVRQPAAGLTVGRFAHYTSRAGDPNVHTHCVLMNVAAGRDGKLRTLETYKLHAACHLAGAAYRAALSTRLVEAFGIVARPAGRGQFEIRGVPQDALDVFSKRSKELEAALAGGRAGSSAAQKEVANLSTRGAKADLPSGPELEARWQREFETLGANPWEGVRHDGRDPAAQQDIGLDRPFDPPEIVGTTPAALAASALFRHETVIDRAALLEQSLIEASLQGVSIAQVRIEMAELERDSTLLPLPGGEPRWTTPALAVVEAALLRAADRPAVPSRVRHEALSVALSAAPELSAEQRAAIEHATGPGGVAVIEAGAGTGKTTIARVLVDAAMKSGLKVRGLAPSWVAADELSTSAAIPVQAIARWRYDLAQGRGEPFDADTLVILDEAGMVGTRDMEAVLTAAAAAGTRVICLGDRRQLAAVAGSSPLRAVVDVLGRHATLGEVRRQTLSWQRAASVLMARGEVEDGLRAYGRHSRIALVSGATAAQERVIALWSEARARHGDDEVIIAVRQNRDAAALNAAARATLRREGKLGPEFVVKVRDRDDTTRDLGLAVGDRLRFGETLTRHGIRNGTRGVVQTLDMNGTGEVRLAVRLDDGRLVTDTLAGFVPDGARRGREVARSLPRLTHAYAGTVYAAQGRTVAEAVLYIGSATDAREVYVGLTRHRQDATVVVERDRLEAAVRVSRGDVRLRPSDAELQERLYVESRRYSEKRNVIDHVEDRAAFIQTGVLSPPRPELALDVRRSFEAGRRLRTTMREIAAAPRLTLWRLALFTRGLDRRLAQGTRLLVNRLRGLDPSPVPKPVRSQVEQGRSGPELSR